MSMTPQPDINGLPVLDGHVVEEPVRDQFDVWVGEWDVTGTAGAELEGHNSVHWVLDGAVLQEDFSGGDDPFAGRSLSVPVTGRGWVQTWVDNTGAYLDFEGGWLGDRMVLERAVGGGARQRMTWHSITADRIVWDWERRSVDEQPWVLNWRLAYSRAAR